MTEDPIKDYVIIAIPAEADTDDLGFRAALEDGARHLVVAQYERPPKAILIDAIEWVFTSDWRDVEKIQPGDGCPTCIAGNDQAQAFLCEHPDRRLALGNIRYWEVW